VFLCFGYLWGFSDFRFSLLFWVFGILGNFWYFGCFGYLTVVLCCFSGLMFVWWIVIVLLLRGRLFKRLAFCFCF